MRSRHGRRSRRRSGPGPGYGWHEHDSDVFTGCERFFRPGYLMSPAARLDPGARGCPGRSSSSGARVADLGCGHGASTLLMAEAFPNSRFTGSDYHEGSIEAARERAARDGPRGPGLVRGLRRPVDRGERPRPGHHLRLPARHGRPGGRRPAHPRQPRQRRHLDDRRAGCRGHRRVEPEPGRPASTTTSRRSCACRTRCRRPGGYALGAQAGEAAIRQVVTDAGFTRFRRVAETPFNLVYEARP